MIAITNMTVKQQEVVNKVAAAGRRGLAGIEFYSDERSIANTLVKKGVLTKEAKGDNVRRGQRTYVTFKVA